MVFTGIGLAWIYERRGSLVAPMAAHVAFNVVGLVVILGFEHSESSRPYAVGRACARVPGAR